MEYPLPTVVSILHQVKSWTHEEDILFLYKDISRLIAFVIRRGMDEVQGQKIPSKSLNLSLMKYISTKVILNSNVTFFK